MRLIPATAACIFAALQVSMASAADGGAAPVPVDLNYAQVTHVAAVLDMSGAGGEGYAITRVKP